MKKIILWICIIAVISVTGAIGYKAYTYFAPSKGELKDINIDIKSNQMNKNQYYATVKIEDEDESKYVYSFDGGKTWSDTNSTYITENGDYEFLIKDRSGTIVGKKNNRLLR